MVDELNGDRRSKFPQPHGTCVSWLIAFSAIVATLGSWLRSRRKGRAGQALGSETALPGEVPQVAPLASEVGGVTDTSNGAKSVLKIDEQKIKDKVRRQYSLVPAIGKGCRWYDPPYRLLWWILTSWRRRLVPWRLRSRLKILLSFLSAFNQYERLKVAPLDDPIDNLIVPVDEEVAQGGIWVIELFPPSMYSNLREALEKNGWDKAGFSYFLDGPSVDIFTQARRGSRSMWRRVGTVVDPKSSFFEPDAMREILPAEFGMVELTALQVGHSLTAVTASFRLSHEGESALNKVWKARHEPMLSWRGLLRPFAEGRSIVAIRATQRERQRLHDLARAWLADRFDGFFAATTARHPAIDFSLFAKFDPTLDMPAAEIREPLRALGMEGDYTYHYTSPSLPGAVLVEGEPFQRYRDEGLGNCWGVVANCGVFAELNENDIYGTRPYSISTLTAISDEAIRGFLMSLAVVRYTEQLSETFSDARDTAQNKHREFSVGQVEQLRRELLTSSLDLPVMARDTRLLWERQWTGFYGVQVNAAPIAGYGYPLEGFDLIERFGNICNEAFERLIQDDNAYRDVLSTVSALGASAASNRLSKRALAVSGTSLIVSATTLLIARGGPWFHQVLEWLTPIWRFWLHN
ncbi:hypothetical protein [Mycolicibacter heraklionensis]|uniref:hypothetical protein n=1 Tax=Mycolicibacter heraklionensis TaxID=512402 RepID=UPI000AA57C70|nr:hypothetical protein [Mycolicibacter heraklionensis]